MKNPLHWSKSHIFQVKFWRKFANKNNTGWAVAFLQKCCYKWRPRTCLGLDVVNLIIFRLKMVKNSLKFTKFSFFIFPKNLPNWKTSPHTRKNNKIKIKVSKFHLFRPYSGNID